MDDAPNDLIVNKAVPMNEEVPERDNFDMPTNVRCATNPQIKSAELHMSQRYALWSRCIKRYLRGFDIAPNVRIANGGHLEQIDCAVEQVFQLLKKAKIRASVLVGRHGRKLDHEIEVASFRVKVLASGRAE